MQNIYKKLIFTTALFLFLSAQCFGAVKIIPLTIEVDLKPGQTLESVESEAKRLLKKGLAEKSASYLLTRNDFKRTGIELNDLKNMVYDKAKFTFSQATQQGNKVLLEARAGLETAQLLLEAEIITIDKRLAETDKNEVVDNAVDKVSDALENAKTAVGEFADNVVGMVKENVPLEKKKYEEMTPEEVQKRLDKISSRAWVDKASALVVGEGFLDNKKALEYLDKAAELHPESMKIFELRALANYKSGKYEQALLDINTAFDLGSGDVRLVYYRGVLNRYMRNCKDAVSFLKDYLFAVGGEDAEAYYHKGMCNFDLQHYDEAAFDFSKAINKDEKYHKAYHYRARAYSALGYYARAIDDYKKAIKFDPTDNIAYVNMSQLYKQIGEEDKAVESINLAIAADPNSIIFLKSRADMFYKMNDYPKAIEDYSKLLGMGYSAPDVIENRGTAYEILKNYENAEKDYGTLIKINAGDTAYFKRGKMRMYLEDFDGAIKDFSAYLKVKERDKTAYMLRGRAYHMLLKFKESWSDFNTAVRIDPKDDYNYYMRGVNSVRLNKKQAAFKDLERAIIINPQNSDALFEIGLLYKFNKNYEKAIASFTAAVGIDPNNMKAIYNRAYSYRAMGKHSEAAKDFETVMQSSGDFKTVAEDTADANLYAKNYEKAEELYSEVLKKDPENVPVRINFGVTKRRTGRFLEAAEEYKKALSVDKGNPEALVRYGNLFDSLGDYKKAVVQYNKAVKSDPSYALAFYKRGMTRNKMGNSEDGCADLKQACSLGFCDGLLEAQSENMCR